MIGSRMIGTTRSTHFYSRRIVTTQVSDAYLQLVMKFPPRPIRSEAEFMAVQTVIDDLLDSPNMTPEKQDYLNVLGMLVHEYEEKNVPIPDLSGVKLLKALIEELGLKQKDLIPIFKTESIISAILHGQRKFTVEHIDKLAEFFHVSPSVFFENRNC